jgi:glycosyltransferase involved in cell wall biosynthesis
MRGDPADAAYLLLKHVAAGLASRGHQLTYLAQLDLGNDVCTQDLRDATLAPHTWTASPWFELVAKGTWRVQKTLGVPYLNVFSNYRLYDACLQCLPGHDVVYERNGLYRGGVARACTRLSLPYVLFVDADEILEHDYMGAPITGMLRRRAECVFRNNLRAADFIVCVSEAAKTHLASAWQAPAGKIVVFPNGVDVRRFSPSASDRSARRAGLGVNGEPVVLFVGSFYEWHDVSTLLDAFARVLTAHPAARLVLVGDGTTRQSMERRAGDLGVSHAVRFTGLVPHQDVPGLVAAADIAVVPYPPMQQALWLSPLKLFEYMASGRAVVASAVGQILQVVEHGSNGLLVPPGDAPAMAAAIGRLIGDVELRDRLGRRARQDAVERHSWERYVARLEDVFHRARTKRREGSAEAVTIL